MRIGVPKETLAGERRVGLVPEGVEKLRDRGLDLRVESGAGRDFYVDRAYSEVGAEVVGDAAAVWAECDLVAKVRSPSEAEVSRVQEGTAVVSFLQPATQSELVARLAERGATAISMDAIPRIARAQSMDALSSMSSVGGYKSVLIGANALGRYLPMMTTAAGTTKAARVLVLGAGVAGLQAIATARRLGAEVTGFDIRPEVREQIESLGASFLEERPPEPTGGREPKPAAAAEPEPAEPRSGVGGAIDWLKDVFELGDHRRGDSAVETTANGDSPTEQNRDAASGPGGYAREQSEDKQRRDREMIRQHLRDVDLVITTALVPGKRAPILLTAEMVEAMRPGSVVVDLAAEAGGNCELTRPGEVTVHDMVEIHGPSNLPSGLPIDSSRLYSRNVVNLLGHLIEDGELRLDLDDEITDAVCLTHRGEVRSEVAREALA
jgi:NAD(P) transhydrogenase subunit alpha